MKYEWEALPLLRKSGRAFFCLMQRFFSLPLHHYLVSPSIFCLHALQPASREPDEIFRYAAPFRKHLFRPGRGRQGGTHCPQRKREVDADEHPLGAGGLRQRAHHVSQGLAGGFPGARPVFPRGGHGDGSLLRAGAAERGFFLARRWGTRPEGPRVALEAGRRGVRPRGRHAERRAAKAHSPCFSTSLRTIWTCAPWNGWRTICAAPR